MAIPLPLNSLLKNILTCDVNGDFILFLSWIYMNFPLCYLSKTRIPVEIMIFATTSLYNQVEGSATQLPFVIKFCAMPQWKKMAERSHHLISFLNQNPQVSGFRVKSHHNHTTKGMPCGFHHYIRKPMQAKHKQNMRNMGETHKKHASLSGFQLHSSSTFLPFSYRMRVLPVPLSHRDNDLVLCKRLSKFHKPPLKWCDLKFSTKFT